MIFDLPSRLKNETGEERRVGFEFEFSGLQTEEAACLITQLWGGRIKERNRFDLRVTETRLGDFSVEFDAQMLKNEEYLSLLQKMGIETAQPEDRERWEKWIENAANTVVPYEIGSPPLPISRLQEMEKLRESMRKHHALGTKAKVQYAFGMHLNPEVPDTSAETLLAVLRSFLIHYPWLCEVMEIDWTRRITPFIKHFPEPYLHIVLDPCYHPTRKQLILDYLEHNPTRNRPLDLLPVFCFVDEATVRERLPDEKIKARPAFHYRLPNCLFDDPEWRVARDWNHWVRIENLAWDGERLAELSARLLIEMEKSPVLWSSHWTSQFSEGVVHA